MLRPTLHDATAALAEAEELRVRARRSNDDRALLLLANESGLSIGWLYGIDGGRA